MTSLKSASTTTSKAAALRGACRARVDGARRGHLPAGIPRTRPVQPPHHRRQRAAHGRRLPAWNEQWNNDLDHGSSSADEIGQLDALADRHFIEPLWLTQILPHRRMEAA